jgi:hypothetical protein
LNLSDNRPDARQKSIGFLDGEKFHVGRLGFSVRR